MKCIQCGNCCRSRSIDITFSDILRWNVQERWDILSEVSYVDNYPRIGHGGFYIEGSLKTKEDPDRHCPFLSSNNKCLIHDTKPSGCFDTPLAYKDFEECPVFIPPSDKIVDLMVKKQTKDIVDAKRNLNVVMNILIKARENWHR